MMVYVSFEGYKCLNLPSNQYVSIATHHLNVENGEISLTTIMSP